MSGRVFVDVKSDRKLRGIISKSSYSNKTFYSFLGIPYAKPPLGDLRFRPPVREDSWQNMKDATMEKDECIQFSIYHRHIIGSEDCLYLNIHCSEKPTKKSSSKAVIVLIHSGGHLWGSGTYQTHGCPDFIMHHDIVYVTLNYRLHVLGFLNLNIPECPGNVGIQDIIMALEWVKENISYFGGDPNNITLCGQCTGASLIHFLMMIPSTKGLYHKVIMMGDYIFNPLVSYRDSNEDMAFELGRKLGYTGSEDEKKLVTFLKQQPALAMMNVMHELVKILEKKYGRILPVAPFLPTIQNNVPGALIPRSPIQLMDSIEPVPVIFGFCDNEAVFGFLNKGQGLTEGRNYKKIMRQNKWSWPFKLNHKQMMTLVEEIKKFYFGEEKVYNPQQAINIYNDISVVDFYDTFASIIFRKSPSTPVYVYKFSYIGNLNGMRTSMGMLVGDEIIGSVHSDDYFYMNKILMLGDYPINEKDSMMIENFCTCVTNFAKTGSPNDESLEFVWNPSSSEEQQHLIFKDVVEMRAGRINEKRVEFWDKMKKIFFQNELE